MSNIANLITAFRVLLIFIALIFLSQDAGSLRVWGGIFLLVSFFLDGVDGFTARRSQANNHIGSLLDTLGDRITENVLLMFFAYKQLIPLSVPVVFIVRSFISDFIRFLAFHRGIGTFEINRSRWGAVLVASKTSRSVYLLLKFFVFLLAAGILIHPSHWSIYEYSLNRVLIYTAWGLIGINVVRFIALVFDSRDFLQEIFLT